MKPLTVTFDCWSTLLYEPEPLRSFEPRVQAVAHAARSAGKPVDDETARLALDAAWRRHSALWNKAGHRGFRNWNIVRGKKSEIRSTKNETNPNIECSKFKT